MTATATVEHPQGHIDDYPEGPVVKGEEPTRIERVEDLPDELRRVLVARREAGTTLAELKRDFAWVAPDVIREVLPPANARERKQRQAKEAKAKVIEVKQGIGGKPTQGEPEPKAKAKQAEPKPKPEPKSRYVEGEQVAELAERVVAARQLIGRTNLAELLHVTGSACWRFEHGRVHPDELDGLISGMSQVDQRIEQGEFVKPDRAPKAKAASKADLEHRIDTAVAFVQAARGDKGVTKSGLIDGVLALLEPPAEQ